MPALRIPASAHSDLEAMYRAGRTLHEIGSLYGVTRERVRQILARRGIHRAEGGVSERKRRNHEARKVAKNAACIRRFGCTLDQLRAVCPRGWSTAASRERTPMGAFLRQRTTARNRGIEWKFKFWDWWQLWVKSGRWGERGRGYGYVMSRIGDQGPYSTDNVRIVPGVENVREYYDRERAVHGRVRRGPDRKRAA